YLVAPDVVANIWHSSKFSIVLLYAIFVPFVVFELLVLRVIQHRIEVGGDVPALRRYLSVLIETSLPSVGPALHVSQMGPAQARDTVTNLFGQHVSPQVVERLLASGADGATDTRTVAVMFVDIRGFTAAARQRTPIEVVQRLDSAFAVLVEIVDRHHGIVNKFLGDGFLALFGAPLADP